ncbi:MAG: protein kinase [Peptococcaceae bacterium]|nr:protein kinase [Peptococcaceae bacterium]
MLEDIKKYEPLWDAWYAEELIGQGSYGEVYKARRTEFGRTFESAVKIISIPQNEGEIRRLKLEGLDESSVRGFFYASVQDLAAEIDLMREFSGTSHIVSILDHKIVDKSNLAHSNSQLGWDILIRMELLKSLNTHVAEHPLSAAEVVKLGIHICRALELCARKNIIHRDIKPENIFISPHGDYKIGDFGVARQVERTMGGLSIKGSSMTMAPEVFKGEQYGASVDTYGLGIVMYALLNMNRAPFIPAYPQPILPSDRDTALEKRMRGEPIPSIPGISSELNALVLQSCAHGRRERFSDPAAMRMALQSINKGVGESRLDSLAIDGERQDQGEDLVDTGYSSEDFPPEVEEVQQPGQLRKLAPGADGNTLHLLPSLTITTTQEGITQQETDDGRGLGETEDNMVGKAAENGNPPDSVIPNLPGSKKMIPVVVVALSIIVALAIMATIFMLMSRNPVPEVITYVQGYGIRVNDEVDIVLSDREEAEEVLDEFTAYYTNQAAAEGYVVTLVTYEEEVEIVETEILSSEIKNKQEALESLNDGSIQTAYFIATEMTTVPEIAQKYKVTADSILAENVGLILESPLEEGTQVKLAIVQPRISVILEGTRVITEEIDFETETKEDPDVPRGTTEEKEGEKGIKSISQTFVSRNGIIVKDTVIEEAVTKEPVNKIVIIGTKLFASLKDAVAALPGEDAVRFIWQTLDGRWYFTKGNSNAFKITYMEFSRDKPGTIIMVDDSGTYVVELKEAVKYDDDTMVCMFLWNQPRQEGRRQMLTYLGEAVLYNEIYVSYSIPGIETGPVYSRNDWAGFDTFNRR